MLALSFCISSLVFSKYLAVVSILLCRKMSFTWLIVYPLFISKYLAKLCLKLWVLTFGVMFLLFRLSYSLEIFLIILFTDCLVNGLSFKLQNRYLQLLLCNLLWSKYSFIWSLVGLGSTIVSNSSVALPLPIIIMVLNIILELIVVGVLVLNGQIIIEMQQHGQLIMKDIFRVMAII